MTEWSDDEAAQIVRLWREGLSASKIAKQVTTPTRPRSRAAVIGRLYRMGEMRGDIARQGTARLSQRIQRIASPPKFRRAPLPRRPPVLVGDHKTLTELGRRDCKWPMTDCLPGAGDSVLFCATHATPGSVYCAYHHRIAFRPVLQTSEPDILGRFLRWRP